MNTFIKRILILFIALGSTIAVAFGFLQEGSVQDTQLPEGLRIQAIQQLIDKNFDHFVTMPFGPGSDNIHLTGSQVYPEYPNYYLNTGLIVQDDLDILLEKKIQELSSERSLYAKLLNIPIDELLLTDEDIQTLKTVYFFKSQQDLEDLGYVVSSYRTRINNDPDRRQANIFNSYRNVGNVRVINPGQELSFMDEIHYEPSIQDHKRDLASGLATMGGLVSIKGGGICGAAWGIHSTIISNKAFVINERFNHSISYNYLYQNTINGQDYWIPGLDVAVFRLGGNEKDFLFKNTREYPVILVLNYDGNDGSLEESFVLSKEQDRGYVKYIGSKGNCYTREANERKITSCYKKVVK